MRSTRYLLVAALLLLPVLAQAKDQIAGSVVKIFTTQRYPDLARPWKKANAQEVAGSGAIIAGKRILTNAHVVLYASQIFVQADQTTDRVPATVVAIAPGVDLAVLQVEKASFFDDRPPLALAKEIPAIKQSVSVYGYPIGGEQISVTQGIVSRVECTTVYYDVSVLRIQIDAAINPGNSGGPAIADGRIIGLVHSKLAKGENIGYLIAADEIQMFLTDIQHGSYPGKPQTWDVVEPAENPALRTKLGLGKETGMVVCHPFSDKPDYPLKQWDLIMKVGGIPLDNRGDVKIKEDLRVSANYLISKLAKNGRIHMTIFRNRKAIEVDVPVRPDNNLVIPYLTGAYPRYFVCGPMVFSAASQELVVGLALYNQFLARAKNPLIARMMDHPAFDGEEIVTLGPSLLPHRISKGYQIPPFSVVARVNGIRVRNLAHLVEIIRDAGREFLTIEVAGENILLVFRREEVLRATEDVLADEGIRRQYSADLERVWHPAK